MMKDDNKQLYNFKYQIRTPNKKLLIGELIQKNGAIFLFVKCYKLQDKHAHFLSNKYVQI